MHRFSRSADLAVMLKANDNFRSAAMLFHIPKKYRIKSCTVFKYLSYTISRIHIKWRQGHSHHRSSRIHHVVIKTVELLEVWAASDGTASKPSFMKSVNWFKI
jgi:hypothetical protein